MLKQRILTALIMVPVAIGGVFFLPPLQFTVFIGLILAVAGWEWSNLAGFSGAPRAIYCVTMVLALALVTLLPPLPVLIAACLWWLGALLLVVTYPDSRASWSRPWLKGLIGFVLLPPGMMALTQLKLQPDANYLILLLFFLIWGADIGAYFAGRAFGRAKLAPRVSPGKSWAGVYGGLLVAALVTVGMSVWLGRPSLTSGEGLAMVLAGVLVAAISVLGDLVESMFKRERGLKDSSGLLPGHGGFLDRLDSLLAAAPVFALLVLIGWSSL